MYRFRNVVLITCLLFGVAGAASSVISAQQGAKASGGRSWTIPRGTSESRLSASGALDVSEAITADFSGLFFGFYRDIPVGPEQHSKLGTVGDGSGLEYTPGGSSSLGSTGKPGRFGSELLPDGLRVVWHHSTSGPKTFTVKYSIAPVGDRYSNADIVDASIWGDQWESVARQVSGTLLLPKSLPQGATVAVDPAWLKAKVRASGNQIRVAAENVPGGEGVRLLVRLPRGWLPGATVSHTGPAPDMPSAGVVSNLQHATTRQPALRFIAWSLLLLLVGELPAWAWLEFNRRRLKDPVWAAGGPVYKPPPGQSLVVGFVAANEDRPPESRAIVATLMDLVARGFYLRENVRDDASGDWRLQIALPLNPRTVEPVSDGEVEVLAFFDMLLEAGPCVVDDLALRVNPSEHRKLFKSTVSALLDDGRSLAKHQHSRKLLIKVPAVGWLFVASWIAIGISSPISTVLGPMLLAPFALIAFGVWQMKCWPRGDFVRSSQEIIEIQGPWRAWRDFILHFKQMEQAPDLAVILWERAFAGALMWGVAEEFVERAKVLVPELGADSWGYANSVSVGYLWGPSISSAAVPANTGGSFGSFGGDGGGGGGGGGGAW